MTRHYGREPRFHQEAEVSTIGSIGEPVQRGEVLFAVRWVQDQVRGQSAPPLVDYAEEANEDAIRAAAAKVGLTPFDTPLHRWIDTDYGDMVLIGGRRRAPDTPARWRLETIWLVAPSTDRVVTIFGMDGVATGPPRKGKP